ncbi:hypothetical protein AgCh_038422 [Apium graveolens]
MVVDAVVTNLKSRARMISTSEEIAQDYEGQSLKDTELKDEEATKLAKNSLILWPNRGRRLISNKEDP